MKDTILSLILLLLISCNPVNNNNSYCLEPGTNQIIIPIDNNTSYYSESMFIYTDQSGSSFLSMENTQTNELNFYTLDSCKLSHKIKIAQEGPNGISNIWGHHIISLDSILVYSFNKFSIYLINRQGQVLQTYKLFENKDPLFCNPPISMIYNPMIIVDSCLYLNQYLKYTNTDYDGDALEKYPIVIQLNMKNSIAKKMPLTYPRLWEHELSNPIFSFSREFDGKNFIFSFDISNYLYVTKDNNSFERYDCKSRYIKTEPINHYSQDPFMAQKQITENESYGAIIYDKYRNVYYRFVYHQCEISKQEVSETFKTRKKFSIIILNSKFQIIGESFFPENTYIPKMFFINNNGLYISNNNPGNPNFNENQLRFQQIELKKTK